MRSELAAPPAQDMAAYEEHKRRLVGQLCGRVLEVGAGAGANFGRLSPDVEWVGLEPDRGRRRQLAAARAGCTILDATAEHIPLPDNSVDAVLATIVLCSVRDPDRALAEIVRVLRPGGRFVFFEHVAAVRGTWTRRWQGLAAPFSRVFDHGCDPTRETWRALEQAQFRELELSWFARGRSPFIGGLGVA